MDNIEFLLDYKIIFRFQATKHIEISFLKYKVNFVEKFENFFFFLFRINTCRNLTSNLRSWSDKRQTKAVICNRKLIKIDTDAQSAKVFTAGIVDNVPKNKDYNRYSIYVNNELNNRIMIMKIKLQILTNQKTQTLGYTGE